MTKVLYRRLLIEISSYPIGQRKTKQTFKVVFSVFLH